MKKVLLLACIATIGLLISSCSKTDELKYSCDPDINEWAVENIDAIRKMDRPQFLKLESLDHQRAAYNVFTPEQKIELWEGKLAQVLNLNVWDEKERAHIESVYSMIKQNCSGFVDKGLKTKAQIEIDEDQLVLAIFMWRDFASESLNWSEELQYSMIADPNDLVIDNDKNIIRTRGDIIIHPGTDTEPKCNCTESWDACRLQGWECKNGGCKETTSDCGALWQQSCTGRC